MPPTCDLCGLPLRYGAVTHTIGGNTLRFCCQGCRMVYTMLVEAGDIDDPARFRDSDLYRQCVAAGVIPASEAELHRMQAVGPAATPASAPQQNGATPPDTLPLDLTVDGMWCPACAWVIETALARLDGVSTAVCHFTTDRLRCHFRPDRTDPETIRQAIHRLGYPVHDADATGVQRTALRRELVRLILTGLLSANVMMLSWALYAGFFTDLSADAVFKISLPIALMATVAMIYGGGPMLRKAWFGIVHRAPGMETLVGLAAGCAFVYSIYNWIAGSIHLYFDTACMLITLVLLGKLLEGQARERVRRDLDAFFALQPGKVRMITAGWATGRWVAIDQLAPGDRFIVEADEIVPADGRVVSGHGSVDESALTGESQPVAVRAGDAVKSGTRTIDGRIEVRADAIGEVTVLGQMIAIMTRSLEQKSTFESRSDHVLRVFVPVIVLLAAGTGIFWAMAGLPLSQTLVRAVTVMVISCPCALGVAIPMARLAGVSLAGRRGILVREIDAFERAGDVDTVVFDKTGTLTRGRWQLERIHAAPDYAETDILAWAAGLEGDADHEIARSIRARARRAGILPAEIMDIRPSAQGIEGRSAGRVLRIGSRSFAGPAASSADGVAVAADPAPRSTVYLSVDGQPAATMVFEDAIRPGVPALVDALGNLAMDLHLISGDGDRATRAVGRQIGIEQAAGSLLPSEKAARIDRLQAAGRHVAMVGDGVNDGAAMARAHLSVAVHSGAGLAREAAHITLMRGDPGQLLEFLPLARKVNAKVSQNLWCAWVYNLIGIPVAMSGLLTPLIAATAMLLSSLSVIGNTLLLVRREP
jgi:heavy metal translocating P-type ATPase